MAVIRPSTSAPLVLSRPSISFANKVPSARVKPSTVTTWLSRPATLVTPSLNCVVPSVLKVINEPVWPTLKVKLDPLTAVTVPCTSSISPSSSCWLPATPGALAVMLKDVEVKAIPFTTPAAKAPGVRSEEHTSELQSQSNLVCRLLLEKKKNTDRQKRGKTDKIV